MNSSQTLQADDMNVVRHQAVGEDMELEATRVSAEPGQVPQTVLIAEEHILPPIAPDRYVLGYSNGYYPYSSRYTCIEFRQTVNKQSPYPFSLPKTCLYS